MILCIFCDVFKVYLSNIDSETSGGKKRRKKKGDWIFSRMPNMQVLYSYYVKKTHESNVALTDVWLYLKIWAQWIIYKTID